MMKRAQSEGDDYSVFGGGYNSNVRGKTLTDLYMAIRADQGISQTEKQQLISQIQGMVGFSGGSTPISALMYKGLGGVIGYLISKYFGMGPMGQLISSAVGFGLGSVLNDKLNEPPNPMPGWHVMG